MTVAKKMQLLLTAVLAAFWISACSPITDEAKALSALRRYFTHLNDGKYAEAADLYGGDYDVLAGWNPDIDPGDHAALFERGCSINGLQCLAVEGISAVEHSAPGTFEFYVQFKNEDGSLYLQEAVNTSSSGQLAESVFKFTVVRASDSFYVRDLPVYQP